MEGQLELQRTYRQQQEKYTYYIIALCIAAIAFSVHETMGVKIKWQQTPLALAVLSWSISIISGLRFLQYVTASLYLNNTYLDVLEGRDKRAGNHPEKIAIVSNLIRDDLQKKSDIVTRYGKLLNFCFYFGSLAFICWHILEMCY